MSQYARFKRKNQTLFLHFEPSEKASEMAAKIGRLNEKPADEIQLIFKDDVLEGDKTAEDHKVGNDDVIYFVYKMEGSHEWEGVDVDTVPTEEGADENV